MVYIGEEQLLNETLGVVQILHTVHSAKKGWVSAPRGELRLRNVNLFLNGLVSLLKRQRSKALNSDKLLIATGLVCRYD